MYTLRFLGNMTVVLLTNYKTEKSEAGEGSTAYSYYNVPKNNNHFVLLMFHTFNVTINGYKVRRVFL